MLSVLIYKLKDLKTKKRSFHNERLLEIAFEVGKIVQWDIGTITDQSVVSEIRTLLSSTLHIIKHEVFKNAHHLGILKHWEIDIDSAIKACELASAIQIINDFVYPHLYIQDEVFEDVVHENLMHCPKLMEEKDIPQTLLNLDFEKHWWFAILYNVRKKQVCDCGVKH